MERRTYPPKRRQIVVLILLLLFCLAIIGGALFAGGGIVREPDAGERYGRFFSAGIFGLILVGALRSGVKYYATFEVDETGFNWRSLFKSRRYDWGDIVAYRRVTESNQGYTLVFKGKREVTVQFFNLERGDEFKGWIDRYVIPYIGNWLYKPEPERGDIVSVASERNALLGLTVILGPTLIGLLWFKVAEDDRNWTILFPIAIVGGLAVVQVFKSLIRKTVLTEEALEFRGLLHSWRVRLEDVWEIRISCVATNYSMAERITLATMEKVYRIGSAESEYIRLRNAIIERTPMATIIDQRSPEQQTYLPRVDYYFIGDGNGTPFHE